MTLERVEKTERKKTKEGLPIFLTTEVSAFGDYIEVFSGKDQIFNSFLPPEESEKREKYLRKHLGINIKIDPGTGFTYEGILIGVSDKGYPVIKEGKKDSQKIKEGDYRKAV